MTRRGRPPRRELLARQLLAIVDPYLAPVGRREVARMLEEWCQEQIDERERATARRAARVARHKQRAPRQ